MTYDAIIIGARVAGSSLAILLGRQGRRVLLVDRERFPSDTLSTHLMQPPAVALLRRLGALADVEASGLRRLGRLRTAIGDTVIEGANQAPGAYALCARRAHLDSVLIRHALKHPTVTFHEQTTVEGLMWEDGRVAGVHVRAADGGRQTVRARVVVGADGKYSKVAGWVGAARYEETSALRPVYYAYYHGITPQPTPAVEVFYHGSQIGYVMPMEPGVDCLALEILPEEFAGFRADPAGRFEAAMRGLPGMAERMAGARRQGPVRGTRGVENYLRVPYGPGWALNGDAAFCKDPSTGTGIGDAFHGAFLLAEALEATFGKADWETTMAAFHERRDATVMSSYRSTLAHTMMAEAPAESLALLQAVAANAGLARLLGSGFATVRTSGIFPDRLLPTIERSAALFAADGTEAEQRAA